MSGSPPRDRPSSASGSSARFPRRRTIVPISTPDHVNRGHTFRASPSSLGNSARFATITGNHARQRGNPRRRPQNETTPRFISVAMSSRSFKSPCGAERTQPRGQPAQKSEPEDQLRCDAIAFVRFDQRRRTNLTLEQLRKKNEPEVHLRCDVNAFVQVARRRRTNPTHEPLGDKTNPRFTSVVMSSRSFKSSCGDERTQPRG